MRLKFEFEKETKGTIRYKETAEDPAIGTLYVKKARLKDLGLSGRAGEAITLEIAKEETE